MADGWPEVLEKGDDVAIVLDWVRRKTKGRALVGVMVGVNGVAISRDIKMSPRDAIELLRSQLDTIERALEISLQKKETRGAAARVD
jgi:hypothetical protein